MHSRQRIVHGVLILALLGTFAGLTSCELFPPPTPTTPPSPIDFARVLDYAQRSALVYDSDEVIRQKASPGATVTISPATPTGVKAYVETNDANKVQWVVVRGTSNLANVKLDVDYNKVVDPRLQVPLHKGFAEAALVVYHFVKTLLKPGYETRVTGHSLGGAAAVIVLMLLKEDGVTLGPAMTFGQPKVTNRQGAAKYRSLPLLRFVNDKDPVPLMPPLDLFSLLDEGPFQHFGPEVVLGNETMYQYYPEHQAERFSVTSFWQTLGQQEIPDHPIARYIQSLQQKIGH
ncbi:MAG TPA: lipase family protein [Nitrospiraceae bacterium]|nr:lipase family protein [Nitrospiraceae bacterium]